MAEATGVIWLNPEPSTPTRSPASRPRSTRTVENIGAKRLHTVLERIVEEISFSASDHEEGAVIVVGKDLVQERVSNLLVESDVSKYIL